MGFFSEGHKRQRNFYKCLSDERYTETNEDHKNEPLAKKLKETPVYNSYNSGNWAACPRLDSDDGSWRNIVRLSDSDSSSSSSSDQDGARCVPIMGNGDKKVDCIENSPADGTGAKSGWEIINCWREKRKSSSSTSTGSSSSCLHHVEEVWRAGCTESLKMSGWHSSEGPIWSQQGKEQQGVIDRRKIEDTQHSSAYVKP